MTTFRGHSTSQLDVDFLPSPTSSGEGKPWLIATFALIMPIIPTVLVLPGPLRGNGSPARLLAFACLALAAWGYLTTRRKNPSPATLDPGAVLILIYFLLLVITYGYGQLLHPGNPTIDSSKTRTLTLLLANVGIALYTIWSVRTQRQRSIVLGCLLVGLTYSCVLGLIQQFLNLDLRFTLAPPGLVQVVDAGELSTRQGATRVVGTAAHPIEFGVLAAVAVPLSLHFTRFAEKSLTRQLSGIACVLAFISVPASVSRAGALALIVAMIIYMFALPLRFVGNIAILGMGGLLAYKILFPSSINALLATFRGSGTDTSILDRTADYAEVGERFREHPWLGLGLGGYPFELYRTLDNQWLQTLVQGGIVGVLSLALFSIGGIAAMTRGLRNSARAKDRDQVYAVGSAFVGILLASFTLDLFAFLQATMTWFLLWGVLWTYRPMRTSADRTWKSRQFVPNQPPHGPS